MPLRVQPVVDFLTLVPARLKKVCVHVNVLALKLLVYISEQLGRSGLFVLCVSVSRTKPGASKETPEDERGGDLRRNKHGGTK